eukprot:g13675.t1
MRLPVLCYAAYFLLEPRLVHLNLALHPQAILNTIAARCGWWHPRRAGGTPDGAGAYCLASIGCVYKTGTRPLLYSTCQVWLVAPQTGWWHPGLAGGTPDGTGAYCLASMGCVYKTGTNVYVYVLGYHMCPRASATKSFLPLIPSGIMLKLTLDPYTVRARCGWWQPRQAGGTPDGLVAPQTSWWHPRRAGGTPDGLVAPRTGLAWVVSIRREPDLCYTVRARCGWWHPRLAGGTPEWLVAHRTGLAQGNQTTARQYVPGVAGGTPDWLGQALRQNPISPTDGSILSQSVWCAIYMHRSQDDEINTAYRATERQLAHGFTRPEITFYLTDPLDPTPAYSDMIKVLHEKVYFFLQKGAPCTASVCACPRIFQRFTHLHLEKV